LPEASLAPYVPYAQDLVEERNGFHVPPPAFSGLQADPVFQSVEHRWNMNLQQHDIRHDPSLAHPLQRPVYRPSTLRPIPTHRMPTAPLPQSSELPNIKRSEQAEVNGGPIKAKGPSQIQEEPSCAQHTAGREGAQTAARDGDSVDLVQNDENGAAQGSNTIRPSADDQQARVELGKSIYSANTTRQRDSSNAAEKQKPERAKKKKFSREDDELLLALKEDRGMVWDRIGAYFPQRRLGQLQYRYYAKLRPNESLSIRAEKPIAPLLAYGPLEDHTRSTVPYTIQAEDGDRQEPHGDVSEERHVRAETQGLLVSDGSEEPSASRSAMGSPDARKDHWKLANSVDRAVDDATDKVDPSLLGVSHSEPLRKRFGLAEPETV